ncbi:MAG: hypothetical protein H0W00_00750, partial [Chloroflexi bacterium]|nr:hypothetical protein [Chloroflexota bacterium]
YRVEVRDAVPVEAVSALDDLQLRYLGALAVAAEGERPASGDAWQDLIFRTAKDLGLASGHAFAALYLCFLGRPNGPRAGWLLASLDDDFVLRRLRETQPSAAAPDVGGGPA